MTLVDSDVFSLLYVRSASMDSRVAEWQEYLGGRRVVVSFQTHAEILAGAYGAGWGQRRTDGLIQILARSPTIHSDADVVEAFAKLTAECMRMGHALHDKVHTGDRWIAACAIAKDIELLAGDGIFQDAPGLTLRH
ncbi:MAG: PIN domain-containing protein [Mycobacterium sp.]